MAITRNKNIESPFADLSKEGLFESVAAALTGGVGGTSREELPKTVIWGNIGKTINGEFISLPKGLALDTMKPIEIKGQNKEWLKKAAASNALLKALVDIGFKLEPGQTVTLNFELQIRHAADAAEVPQEDNEYIINVEDLLSAA